MPVIDSRTLHELYGYVLTRKGGAVREADFAAVSGGSAEEAAEAAQQLVAMGLLLRDPELGLVAVSPEDAVAKRLHPRERDLRAQRAQIERTRSQLLSFLPVFEAGLSSAPPPSRVEVIEDLPHVLAAIAELAAGCEEEVLTAQPGGGRTEAVLEEALPRDEAVLRRGVRMRVLYQDTARLSPGTTVYVERVSRLGAQVRTLDDHFARLLVFDRKAAVIEVPGDPDAAAVVREPNIVAFIADTYQRLWLAARPFTVDSGSRTELQDGLRAAIVRLLSEGMTDTSIALRLGMSVRTCRRHIADLMAELGAQSRFQAGYACALIQLRHGETQYPSEV